MNLSTRFTSHGALRTDVGVAVIVVVLFSIAAGCNSYKVTVDSLARENAERAISYRIQNKKTLTGNETPPPEQAAAYVRTALSGRGLYEAPPNVKADLVVELDYGVGSPITRIRVVMEPVVSSVTGKIIPVTMRDGVADNLFDRFREKTITTTTYEKYLRLTARENVTNTTDPSPNEIWTVDVTSTGESRDLGKYLPVLVAATIEYIGRDTHGQKTIKLKDSDADVLFVKKGM